jgi:hypothetical protein
MRALPLTRPSELNLLFNRDKSTEKLSAPFSGLTTSKKKLEP